MGALFSQLRDLPPFLLCRAPAATIEALSPSSLNAMIYPSGSISGPYTLTATTVGGGSPIQVICGTPDCIMSGLSPGAAYSMVVVGTDTSTGSPTPPSPAQTITTPPASAPSIYATVTGPGAITVTVSPVIGTSGPFTITATPIGGGAPITVTCSSASNCSLAGLAPGTSYDVTVTSTGAGSQPTAASAPITVTMPVYGWVGVGGC